jgi:isopentenyl-diphosphate delta-isomerase
MDPRNLVVLVDAQDRPLGTMEKMQAHREARLHRAFSVLILNTQGEMLIHRRALGKYHSGGLWTNACCSHPMPGEDVEAAAHRRLQEEMGFDCPLRKAFSFRYEAALDQGLSEHELDHVFVGTFDGQPQPDPEEVMDWRFVPIEALRGSMHEAPEHYTEWFKIIMEQALPYLQGR